MDHNVTLFGNNVIHLGKNGVPKNGVTAPSGGGQKNAHDKNKKIFLYPAPPELLVQIRERAIQEVKTRFPDTDESLLRVPIRLEENKIIAKEYIDFDST